MRQTKHIEYRALLDSVFDCDACAKPAVYEIALTDETDWKLISHKFCEKHKQVCGAITLRK